MRFRGARYVRRRCYEVLDVGSMHDPLGRFVHRFLVLLVLVSVTAVILESVPSLGARYAATFHLVEVLAGTIFTLEYLLRLWAAVCHPPLRGLRPYRARFAYALQAANVVDLLAIVPFYVALIGPGDWQVLLLLRLVRFFKLARYSPGLRSLVEAVHAERRALIACVVILGGLMIVAAAAMHVVEAAAQPEKFGSIPQSMYWAIITLTTVGYGDVHPVTDVGRVVAGLTAVTGLVMLALPVGIVATAFAEVIHRRDFVVTWNMVAKVPLFTELQAVEIAAIMRYLRSQVVEAGTIIVHRDEPAESMYFIASGTVEVELKSRRIRLDEGHFFGELAILRRGRRTATIRALEATKLLVLDRADFLLLLEQNSSIADRIREIAESRMATQPFEPLGDLDRRELQATGDADDAGKGGRAIR